MLSCMDMLTKDLEKSEVAYTQPTDNAKDIETDEETVNKIANDIEVVVEESEE